MSDPLLYCVYMSPTSTIASVIAIRGSPPFHTQTQDSASTTLHQAGAIILMCTSKSYYLQLNCVIITYSRTTRDSTDFIPPVMAIQLVRHWAEDVTADDFKPMIMYMKGCCL